MALLIRLLYREIPKINQVFYKDPRVRDFPLVGSPIPPLIVITLYILYVTKWGPKWMNDRKPFNLKLLVQIVNIFQVVINGYCFAFGISSSYLREDFSWTCEPTEYNNTSPAKINLLYYSYIYYLTKYLDLLDTVFFVLRKKNSQITFLHVYHHAVMVMAVWLYMTCMGAGHPTMLGIVNSFVHMVMYSYYFASSMDLKIDLIPWKKRLTQIQILQFCYLVFHFSLPLINNWCNTSFNLIHAIAVIQNVFMAAMFSDFYYKAYVEKRTNKKKIT